MNDIITKIHHDLGDALLSCDLWDNETGEIIESINPNEIFVGVFRSAINYIKSKLNDLGFPPVKDYMIINLEMNTMLLFVKLNETQTLGCIIDHSKLTLITLTKIIIPKIIEYANESK